MVEQGSVEQDVEFFGHMPRNGITGSESRSAFKVLRILPTDFHSGCPSL